MQEVVEACCTERAAQKARREMKAKAKEEGCRGGGEEEEDNGVSPVTLGQGARGRGHLIGGG